MAVIRIAKSNFVFNAEVLSVVESYHYLGFSMHATRNMSHGVSHLVNAARKEVRAMRRRCAH